MLLITAICPHCREPHHMQEFMRGKPIRCNRCRKPFIVDDQPPPAPQTSGSVGDVIPLLPVEGDPKQTHAPTSAKATHVSDMLELLGAEADVPDLPLQPTSKSDWASPPPVRRPTKVEPEAPPPSPKPRKEKEPRQTVLEAGDWTAPPVRRSQSDVTLTDLPSQRETPAELPDDGEPPRAPTRPRPEPKGDEGDPPQTPRSDHDFEIKPRTRWVKWLIIPLVLVTVAGLSGGVFMIFRALRDTEEKLARDAGEFYDSGKFKAASDNYAKLLTSFPDVENQPFYAFRKDLSDLRYKVADSDSNLGETLEDATLFLDVHKKNPYLDNDAAGLGDALVTRLTDFARAALAELKPDDKPLEIEEKARPILDALKKVKYPKEAKPPEWTRVRVAFLEVEQALQRLDERKAVVAKLRAAANGKPGFAGIVAVETYLREISGSFPDVANSDEARNALDKAFDDHLAGVRYQAAKAESNGPARAANDQLDEPSILLDPELKPANARPSASPDEVPALALVRGVLYAMDRATGRVRWARRVGIDTTALPVVVPRRVALKDLLLVLSSDSNTLTALNANGDVEWTYVLPAPVLGRPVFVERRAYLATYTGEVHEIELSVGRLLGTYNLGQRVTHGGTLEPGTTRVFFPADDNCVYVLDVEKRRCEQILYSRHPAGSLRGEPIVLPPIGDQRPGFLVLNQATGLDGVRLRVFGLPIRDRKADELPVKPPATLGGWTWFAPYHDPEKLILLSDTGKLGLFGIKQPRNNDQPLFSLLPDGAFDLASRLGGGRRGRAEVVQVEGDDVWALAAGRMQRLRLAWGQDQGPRLVDVWQKPLDVGAPVHASQPFGSRLVTVTQPAGRSCAWVSGVEDEKGGLLWRRQLGLVARGEPVAIPTPQGEPMWLAMDQAGGLFTLDPTRYVVGPATRWLSDDRPALLAEGLAENLDQPPVLLPAPDGKSAYALAFPGDGGEMVVRHVTAAQGARGLQVREVKVALHEKLAGRPVISGARLLLPLANGDVSSLPLPLAANPLREDGPTWRAARVGAEARCVLVPLDRDRFLASDGARGLGVWEWPAGAASTTLPAGRGDEPALALAERVVNAVAVPGTPLVAVSDPRGDVTLVEVDAAKGSLAIKHRWPLGGEVTAGPFVRLTPAGPRLGCVVERSRLVWLDPSAAGVAWLYETKDEAPIVGEPALCDGVLVVADQSGRYVGLNPANGTPVGSGYALRGSVAPVASPVLFQKDRLLAPLSDGTVLLLGTGRLR